MSRGFLIYMCLLAAVCYAIVFLPEKVLADNEIELTQSGNNLNLTIDQIGGYNIIGGYNNEVFSGDISGTDNEIVFHQEHSDKGTNPNTIQIYDFNGNYNQVMLRQGSDARDGFTGSIYSDSSEYSGHTVTLDLDGSNNVIVTGQRNSSDVGHDLTVGVYSDNNTINSVQGYTGQKTGEMYIWSDGNDVTTFQDGAGDHNFYIDVTGSYGTTLDLTQTGTTDQSYSLYQNCQTAGGCSITVTQQ